MALGVRLAVAIEAEIANGVGLTDVGEIGAREGSLSEGLTKEAVANLGDGVAGEGGVNVRLTARVGLAGAATGSAAVVGTPKLGDARALGEGLLGTTKVEELISSDTTFEDSSVVMRVVEVMSSSALAPRIREARSGRGPICCPLR